MDFIYKGRKFMAGTVLAGSSARSGSDQNCPKRSTEAQSNLGLKSVLGLALEQHQFSTKPKIQRAV